MRDLRGRVALVTGAGSGIGRATARALAQEGARLILCDINGTTLADSRREIAGISECVLAEPVDVADRQAMRAFAEQVHAAVPALDVLVNNAGVGMSGGLCDTSLEDWDWILSINLGGVIHGCHFFVPPMQQRGGGQVINVSSAFGYWAAPTVLGYATSKFAVLGLSEALRAELAPLGVGVSVVCPGVVNTGILEGTRFRGRYAAPHTRERAAALFQRGCAPERVAGAIVRAVKQDLPVVPVAPEAWFLYYLKRFLPGLASPFGRLVARQTLGPDVC